MSRLRQVECVTASDLSEDFKIGERTFEELEDETIKGFSALASALESVSSSTDPSTALSKKPVEHSGSCCSETQFSFTIPPGLSPFLYIRYRVAIDGSTIEPWINPLEYRNGTLFSPKLRIKTQKKASILYRVPPPVVLSQSWEKTNIVQDKTYQEEGTLRVFTISGLTPR